MTTLVLTNAGLNAAVNGLVDALDGGSVVIRDATTDLVTFTLGSPAFGSASLGIAMLSAPIQYVAVAVSGTPDGFQIKNSGATVLATGDAGASGATITTPATLSDTEHAHLGSLQARLDNAPAGQVRVASGAAALGVIAASGASGVPGAVSGSFVENNTITLDGGGFGATGPTYEVEWFDGDGTSPVAGDDIDTSNSLFDDFRPPGGIKPKFYDTEFLSKGMCGEFYRGAGGATECKRESLPEFNEMYVQYAFKVKEGTEFPTSDNTFTWNGSSCGGGAASTCWPDQSAWKPVWLIGNAGGTTSGTDYILLSYVSILAWRFGGNSGIPVYTPGPQAEWRGFDPSQHLKAGASKFVTCTFGYKAGATQDAQAPGFYEMWSELTADNTGNHRRKDATFALFNNKPDFGYVDILVNGWFSEAGFTDPRALYDHLYFATGANACRRVIVTDNIVYADSKKQAIQPHLTWSNSQITVEANVQDFVSTEVVHFWVFPAEPDGTPQYIGQLTVP